MSKPPYTCPRCLGQRKCRALRRDRVGTCPNCQGKGIIDPATAHRNSPRRPRQSANGPAPRGRFRCVDGRVLLIESRGRAKMWDQDGNSLCVTPSVIQSVSGPDWTREDALAATTPALQEDRT
jgi:hypothetical protein